MSALDLEAMQAVLETQRFGRSYSYRERTGSTNDDAREAFLAGAPAGHIVVADAQTSGRGSRGRTWESPAGTDLYLSIVDRLPVPIAALPPLTLAVGLAVAETVDSLLDSASAQVKWPNDVLLRARKCAGILIETSMGLAGGDCVVIGIGLNVNRTDFPVELAAVATSLRLHRPDLEPIDRNLALRVLLEHVEARVDSFVADGPVATIEALSPRLALRGYRVRCDGYEGVVRGVAHTGALLLETEHGVEQVLAGRLTPIES